MKGRKKIGAKISTAIKHRLAIKQYLATIDFHAKMIAGNALSTAAPIKHNRKSEISEVATLPLAMFSPFFNRLE